jgi:release factor glutamine methyltransferase
MDFWNIEDIVSLIEQGEIASDREAKSLARWVLEDILCLNDGEKVTKGKMDQLESALQRLKEGEPVQYIAGHAWFFGYQFQVNKSVLIPRPETEELVDWILSDFKIIPEAPLRILDIGTGSGCIAITIKKKLGEKCRVVAIDVSKDALAVAKHNSQIFEAEVEFKEMNFLQSDAVFSEPFDVIVSNPPYVGKKLISAEMVARLKYEPELALYPTDTDVDIFYKKIAERRQQLLRPHGSCYLELNEFRALQIKTLFQMNHWKKTDIREDMQGLPRMLRAIY